MTKDSVGMDSLSVAESSIKVFKGNDSISSSLYRFDVLLNTIVFDSVLIGDSLTITYRVFPIGFHKSYFHKNPNMILVDQKIKKDPLTIRYDQRLPEQNAFLNDGLTKNGSISRGLSFGNNQDVVVNSSMNLQVSGKLSKDLELVLAATDNNIPIQPDGNTQQLQEFDKVYIQVNDANSKLTLGDFQLNRPPSYFMNFYKRTQGILFQNTFKESSQPKAAKWNTSASAAISRGKFARNVVQGVENNQGPYRLKGAENELFIIVLSGTEKVYIDGRLLTRGQENDYVIDYNTAEITFTAKQIITKDKRIVAEFQYAERNFSRSLFYFSEQFQKGKTKAALHVFSEQDNKNKPFQQELSDEEKLLLAAIGDTLNKAIVDGSNLSDFNTIEVFYIKKDTVVASGTYSIFEYSATEDTVYRVKFSFVGEGNGNYRQIQSAANGKVYQWYEPTGGIRQGNYEPVLLLVSPKKKQMVVMQVAQELKNGLIDAEAVYTRNDLNTFSEFDSADDDGYGARLSYKNKFALKAKSDSATKKSVLFFLQELNYEFLQKNFSQIERFRPVEFTRDWNRSNDSLKNNQHQGGISLGLEKDGLFRSVIRLHSFVEETNYRGIKYITEQSMTLKQTRLFYAGSFLSTNNQQITKTSGFYRHKSRLSRQLNKLVFSFQDEMENNRFKYQEDSLLSNSYSFWEWEGSMSNADTSGNRFKVFYRERTDKKGNNSSLKPVAYAQNVGFNVVITKIKNHYFSSTVTYRRLLVLDSLLISTKPDNTLLSRLEYSPRLFKGFFQGNFFYEVGYGLEPRKEYSFIQVAAGQGQYTWIDYNLNSIKELNEFEIAQFSDQAQYIKVFTPTNDYIKAGHNQFSGSVYLRPAVFKRENTSAALKFISRFAMQSVYRLDKKSLATNGVIEVNPFYVYEQDSNLLSTNYSLRQSLFFNQNSSVGGFDYSYQENKSKQLLTNGFEGRSLLVHELRTRLNLSKAFGFFTNSAYGNKANQSEFFSNRNYNILYYETEPKLSYQPNTSIRVSVGYKRVEKRNTIEGGFQKAGIDDALVELKYNKLSKGSFTMRADYLWITYNDAQNTTLAFEMLNALKPGKNMTLSASYQQNINSYLQVSFNYDGRKSPGNKIIHIGGAQVRAFF